MPEGTIVNARRPAPVGGFVELRKRVISLVMGALAQAIPERVSADQFGTAFHNMVGGTHPRTEFDRRQSPGSFEVAETAQLIDDLAFNGRSGGRPAFDRNVVVARHLGERTGADEACGLTVHVAADRQPQPRQQRRRDVADAHAVEATARFDTVAARDHTVPDPGYQSLDSGVTRVVAMVTRKEETHAIPHQA